MEPGTIPTNNGARTVEQIMHSLFYISYASNRDAGMSHEGAVRMGIGREEFRQIYEAELAEWKQRQQAHRAPISCTSTGGRAIPDCPSVA